MLKFNPVSITLSSKVTGLEQTHEDLINANVFQFQRKFYSADNFNSLLASRSFTSRFTLQRKLRFLTCLTDEIT